MLFGDGQDNIYINFGGHFGSSSSDVDASLTIKTSVFQSLNMDAGF